MGITMNEKVEFGEFLSKLRRERNILQKELASHLNVTIATISNYEKGVHSPDIYSLIKIADFFDVSTDYLLQRTTCRTPVDKLNTKLSANCTLNDLLNITLGLNQQNVDALLDYYELLRIRNTLAQNQNKQRKAANMKVKQK